MIHAQPAQDGGLIIGTITGATRIAISVTLIMFVTRGPGAITSGGGTTSGGGAFDPWMAPAACSAFRNCATLDIIPSGSGTGSGTVTDDQGQIDCSWVPGINAQGTCSGAYDWAPTQTSMTVTLTVTPASGSYGCLTGVSCGLESQIWTHAVTLFPNDSTKIGVEFDVKDHRLVVMTGGGGSGTVTSAQFTCPSYPCDVGLFPWGTDLAFEATPAAGSTFVGWTGACATQPAICSLTLTADSDTTAVFASASGATPSPTKGAAMPRPTGAATTAAVPAPSIVASDPGAASAGAPASAGASRPLASLPPVSTQSAASAGPPPVALLLIAAAGILVLAAAGVLVASRRRPAE